MDSPKAFLIILISASLCFLGYGLYFNVNVNKMINVGYSMSYHALGGLKRNDDITSVMPSLNKHSFNRQPEWSVGDDYQLGPKPRSTTCAESIRNSNDSEFQSAFISDIQLFMGRENFSVREFNRLAHYSNPFGFMGYNYSAVKAAIDVVPQPDTPLLLPVPMAAGGQGSVHCAVVATGGILNGSRMGKEIDASDYVFRMNGAVTAGFEEDVGRRTSVYVHTAHAIRSSLIRLRKRGFKQIPHDKDIKYVLIPEGMRDLNFLESLIKNRKVPAGEYKGRTPRSYYGGYFNASSYYVLHPDFLRYVKNRFLRSSTLNTRRWVIYRPTNGAFTLFLAMHTCDTVSAYGFSTVDHKRYSNYYYDKVPSKVKFYANHDYKREINLWKRFHDNKLIKLYQGKE